MQVGVVFPQTEMAADPGQIRAFVLAAEGLGCRHLMAYEHVVGADTNQHKDFEDPYDLHSSFHEPFALFGFITAIAPVLELVTGIIVLPQRQTALVAKQAAEIDVLSRGRFRLGVGLGWNKVEYEALNASWDDRAARFEEQIDLLRLFFTQESVNFQGRFHKVTGAGINPLPVQRPVPLWFGGSAEPALKRAARLADGFFPLVKPHDGWKALMTRMRQWLEDYGRDPKTFGVQATLSVAEGGPDQWRAGFEEWRKLGATHLALRTTGAGLVGAGAHVDRLRLAFHALEPELAGL